MNKTEKLNDFEFSLKSIDSLFDYFGTSKNGLIESEAEDRISVFGFNEPAKKKKRTLFFQLFSKFLNPLVIVLILIGTFSLLLGEEIIGVIFVFSMVLMSVLLSFFQEYRSGKEAERLRDMVRVTATVIRDGEKKEIKIKDIVPGDIVYLSAGDIIPADLRIFSCKDLFINQSSLTGESLPVEKFTESHTPYDHIDTSISNENLNYKNIAYMGSSVVSGSALALVIKTGINTKFGEISKKLLIAKADTAFEKGIKKFTILMIKVMMMLVLVIFLINAVLKGELVEGFLFALAVAVGLTPEMLPMLVAMNLSKGAIRMSKLKVIVKRLNSIQNFGAMDILCTDKTGTLTLDEIILEKHCDIVRKENDDVLKYAYINSFYQTGLKNLLDLAILKHEEVSVKEFEKVDEIPFDFSRRIMSVVVKMDGKKRLVAKGAPEEIFNRCDRFELDKEIFEIENLFLPDLKDEVDRLSNEGFRVLAIAYKDVEDKEVYSKKDEFDLVLLGYVAFLDPPKPSTKEALYALKSNGVDIKILTGDNELVTKKICEEVGLVIKGLITGVDLDKLDDKKLLNEINDITVFARLSPLQKERVIHALQIKKHVVGYLGDGINDAPALKAADVGISVNNAMDIAKESADIILLEKNLMVLEDGVVEGRKTFGNIVKYIKMGASSNFGNMFSMTGASIILPFLPMTPIQILLNNFLYDVSQTAIPTDQVDKDFIQRPTPWNVTYIRKFMSVIGPISSIFDFITFAVLYFFMHASEQLFHTGWFLESLISQTLVIHIIRTNQRPFIESRPSKFLMIMSLIIISVGIFLPFSPIADAIEFVKPPIYYFALLAVIVGTYLILVQIVKKWFIKKYGLN